MLNNQHNLSWTGRSLTGATVGGVTYSFTYNDEGIRTGKNPFLYRGYYYDSDLGFYYLQSRYYDPAIRRFINADNIDIITATPDALTDKNLFSYCDNNPIMRVDHGGEFWHVAIGAVVGAVVGVTVTCFTALAETGKVDLAAIGISAVSGALSGALATVGVGPVLNMVIQMTGNAVISATESFATQAIRNGVDNVDYEQVIKESIVGAISSIGNGLSKATSRHLMKQGVQATRQIRTKGLRKAAKYYLSQTATLFYRPLFHDAKKEIMDTLYTLRKTR